MLGAITLCCFHAASSAQAERQAVNTVCQGSAADLVKLAMIQLHRQLHQQFPGGTCRLLLQVTNLDRHMAVCMTDFGHQ